MNHFLDTAIRFPTPAKVAIYPFKHCLRSSVRPSFLPISSSRYVSIMNAVKMLVGVVM